MGCFSWLTSDTQESIPCVGGGRATRTVYLLQPNGAPSIAEPEYEGYGEFGGVDAYEWLARANLPEETVATLSDEQLRHLGIMLDCGNYYEDAVTGAKISIFHQGAEYFVPDVTHYPVNYAEPLPGYDGKCANDLIAAGHLIKREFTVEVPLKFSFNPNARYEDLPAAEICPNQGCFYDDDEDDD